jgi:hypothetical protein
MLVSNSLIDENTFFIFRDNGVEVKLNLTDNKVFADHELTEDEKTYVNENLLPKKYESKINKIRKNKEK